MKTLYISDLDGTLLNRDAELSDFTRDTLNGLISNGLQFAVATARTSATVERILDGVRLTLPVILMNGVLVTDLAAKKHIRVCAIDQPAMPEIVAVLKKHGATGFMYELRDDLLTTYYENLDRKSLRDFRDERVSRYNKTFTQTNSFADIPHDRIAYVALLDSQEKLLPVRESLRAIPGLSTAFYRDIYADGLWFLELYSDKASKRNAALFLKEYGAFDRIVGFGDNLNDLPLFEASDECYAVANAHPDVQSAATGVIGSNTDDGVARWLAEHCS